MSSLSNITSDIKVERPELWNLNICLDSDSLRFALCCDAQANSLIVRHLPLVTDDNTTLLKALENIIYDNPLFLHDYKEVRISVESMQFLLIPPHEAENSEDLLLEMYPGTTNDMCQCTLTECGDICLAYLLPEGVSAFLSRTFPDARPIHHLLPLCEYYRHRQEEGTSVSRMYVHLLPNRMDVIIYRKGALCFANSFAFTGINDAAYFALAAWSQANLDAMSDEAQLIGDKDLREQLTPILRKYISCVVPAIFPVQAMRLGDDAVKAPLDLILLSI